MRPPMPTTSQVFALPLGVVEMLIVIHLFNFLPWCLGRLTGGNLLSAG